MVKDIGELINIMWHKWLNAAYKILNTGRDSFSLNTSSGAIQSPSYSKVERDIPGVYQRRWNTRCVSSEVKFL